MTRSELKQLIRECLQESLEQGKSRIARDAAQKLTYIVEKIQRPDLEQKARVHAAEIISLIDQDQSS